MTQPEAFVGAGYSVFLGYPYNASPTNTVIRLEGQSNHLTLRAQRRELPYTPSGGSAGTRARRYKSGFMISEGTLAGWYDPSQAGDLQLFANLFNNAQVANRLIGVILGSGEDTVTYPNGKGMVTAWGTLNEHARADPDANVEGLLTIQGTLPISELLETGILIFDGVSPAATNVLGGASGYIDCCPPLPTCALAGTTPLNNTDTAGTIVTIAVPQGMIGRFEPGQTLKWATIANPGPPVTAAEEMTVQAVTSSTTFTAARGANSTAVASHAVGDPFYIVGAGNSGAAFHIALPAPVTGTPGLQLTFAHSATGSSFANITGGVSAAQNAGVQRLVVAGPLRRYVEATVTALTGTPNLVVSGDFHNITGRHN